MAIRESVNDVKFTLLLTVGLVVMVIFRVPAQPLGHR
jgi:multidrug efflux pump subunit AcrB